MTPTEKRKARNWLDFHRRNPIVFDTYCRLILAEVHHRRMNDKLWRGGFAIGAITERLRWDADVIRVTGGGSLNDAFEPYYARLFAELHPSEALSLEYRTSHADVVNYRAVIDGDDEAAVGPSDQFELALGFPDDE